MGKYYNAETVRSEMELDRINADSTDHYIKILESRVHHLMQVREELLEFRDAIADAVNVHGQSNQAILDAVRRLNHLTDQKDDSLS